MLADGTATGRLRGTVGIAKVEHPTRTTARISLSFRLAKDGQPRNSGMQSPRAELDCDARPVIERCRAPILQAPHDAETAPRAIDRVILAGAMGIKMAKPDRDVVCFAGDGACMMANSERATVAMMGLAFTVVVTGNRGFGCINRPQVGDRRGSVQQPAGSCRP